MSVRSDMVATTLCKLDAFRDLPAPLLSQLESCVRTAFDLPAPQAELDA